MRTAGMYIALAVSAAPSLAVALAPLAYTDIPTMADILSSERFSRALALSLATSVISASLAVALAAPAAYYAARSGGAVSRVLSSLHLLILGLPPVGVGISLIIALTQTPLLSDITETLGLAFTVRSIVVAQTVIALPLAASVLTSTFSYIPRSLEEVARVYGASGLHVARHILMPLAAPGVLAAWLLAFFRSMGEFGATLALAGNAPGYTETLPIAMYNMLAVARLDVASALLTLSVAVGAAAVYTAGRLQERAMRRLEGLGEL